MFYGLIDIEIESRNKEKRWKPSPLSDIKSNSKISSNQNDASVDNEMTY